MANWRPRVKPIGCLLPLALLLAACAPKLCRLCVNPWPNLIGQWICFRCVCAPF